MKTIKTLNEALNLHKGQLTADKLLSGRLYTTKGFESFKLSNELKKEVSLKVSEILGGRSNTKERIKNNLYYNYSYHWGLDRLLITKRKNPKDKRKNIINISYCAGQDYTSELRQIRNHLK